MNAGIADRPLARAVRAGSALLLALVLAAVCAQAAAAAPVMDLTSIAATTAAPGSQVKYSVFAANWGDSPSPDSDGDGIADEQRVLTMELPPGMTAASVLDFIFNGWTCTGNGPGPDPEGVVGATTVTCVNDRVSDPGDAIDRLAWIELVADVDPSASGTLTASFSHTGGGAPPVSTVDPTEITATDRDFGVDSFDAQVSDADGAPSTQAGGHPFQIRTSILFNSKSSSVPLKGSPWPIEPVKDVFVDLPPGLVGDPTVTGIARCTLEQLAKAQNGLPRSECPSGAQVGVTNLITAEGHLSGGSPMPVYNMVPPAGVAARFGFNAGGTSVTLDATVRSGGDYGVTVNARNISEGLAVVGTDLIFWGVPADPAHDALRSCPGENPVGYGGPMCPAGQPLHPFLRNPTSCTPAGVGLETLLKTDSWFAPGDFKTASFVSHDPPAFPYPPSEWGAPQGPTGCEDVPFDPSFEIHSSSTTPDSPTGLTVDLSIPQSDQPDLIGQADVKRVSVTLPEGMAVSPSSASGLGGCAPSQIKLDSDAAPTCPAASKIGTVEVETPLLDESLEGAVYLASPHDNPFGSLIALYIVAKGPGVLVKLEGRVDLDPQTGRLTTTFDDNPQLPFSHMHLEFKDGPRAALVNPPDCGTHTVQSRLRSWARPDETVSLQDSFTLDCPGTSGFAPEMVAGTTSPIAGRFSPFTLRIDRDDREGILDGIDVSLPDGLLAKLKGVELCADNEAGNELAGSCPAGSRIGSATVAAGPGSTPFRLPGQVYLTGPYKGAPYGLSVQVPAKAGPFDLGVVKVRQALRVDPEDAHVTVVSDPLPTIREGIPFRLRTVQVDVDRPGFTVNPTSCAEKRISATAHSVGGATAAMGSRFQVADCARLALTPRLAMRLVGAKQTRSGGHPALRTLLRQPAGQANIRRAQVALPKDLVLDPVNANNSGLLCSYEKGLAADCPASSRIGTAVAVSPLLNRPLRGPVHFVQGKRRDPRTGNLIRTLPALLVKLDGEIEINLRAKSNVIGGRLVTTFPVVPDARVSSFRLNLVGGRKRGILTVTSSTRGKISICDRPQRSVVTFRGHNGKVSRDPVGVKSPCRGQAKKRGSARRSR
jgi:hypothetical protein